MEYRKLRNGEKVSVIGLGSGELYHSDAGEIERTVAMALDNGINFMDTCTASVDPIVHIARALKGRRHDVMMQVHFCTIYPKGTYSRTRVRDKVEKGFSEQLVRLGTDYADIGMIHFIDSDTDVDRVVNGGTLDHALKLKQDGVIRYIGFSSHTPATCRKMIDLAPVDVVMLGINPAYDFEPRRGKLALSKERMELYRECQKRGIGITVMKAFSGGQLLDDNTSPFGKAMTIPQCIQYALDRPAVLSCLTGVRSTTDLRGVLEYCNATREQRDYSFIGELPHRDMAGVCVYCNHCQPCPVGIDIGSVNKYMDLAKAGDELAADHYRQLPKHADDCIKCGACETRCPFLVRVRERMEEATIFFHLTV